MARIQRDDIFKHVFNADHIGSGSRFVAGHLHGRPHGLWGALRKIKSPDYGSIGKNLSYKDLKTFHAVIAKHLKAKPAHLRGELLTHFDRRSMYKELSALKKKGEIAGIDIANFKEIVHAINETHRQSRVPQSQTQEPVPQEKIPTKPENPLVADNENQHSQRPPLVELASDRMIIRKARERIRTEHHESDLVQAKPFLPPPKADPLPSENKTMGLVHPLTGDIMQPEDKKTKNNVPDQWGQYRDV